MIQQSSGNNMADMYRDCIALEQKLRAEMKHKNFYEANVRAVRAQLRSAYERLLFLDYVGAQEREVEPALWKSVFYRPIEEFRRRIKAASAAGEKGREPLQKVKIAFGKFLQDAALFYKLLAVKLQTAYGSVGYTAADAQLTAVPSVPDQTYHQHDCRSSVFRCLICLGDIYRYETSVLQHQPKKDWSIAARHYRLAMAVLPSGGNAYNQLAVLSTYGEDDMAAVYYYFRSLAVAKPFTIARENLVLLLEQIRVKCLKLPQRAQPKGQAQKVPMKSKRPVNVLMHELSIRTAHLHGILFSKVNLNDCDEVLPAAIVDLRDLLTREGALQALEHKSPDQQSKEHVLLQLAVLSMFSLYDITSTHQGQKLGYSDVMKQDVLKQATLQVVQRVTGTLAAAAGQTVPEGHQPIGKLVLPTLTILLEWWAVNPGYSTPVNVPQPVGITDPEMAARLDCVNHLTAFLPSLQSQIHGSGTQAHQQGKCVQPAGHQFALAEDWQLRGFLPLQQCHEKLVFEKPEAAQDDGLIWGQRALQALNSIASHPVSFDFARAAAAPVASRQLAQAWQAFKAAVSRDASPPDHPHTAAQAVDAPNHGPLTSPLGAVEAAAAEANVSTSRGLALPEAGTAGKQMDPSDEADDEEVIVYQPQHGRGGQTSATHPLQHTAAEQQAQASGLSSYAPMAAASVKADSHTIHASHPQQQPQQHNQQELQPQLIPQPSHSDMQPQYHPMSTHAPAIQSSQQQQPAASRQPGYATGISSLPPHMPPSSTLLSSHASHPLPAYAVPDPVNSPMPQQQHHQQQHQQQQQMMGQHHGGQASSWLLQTGLQQDGTPLPPQQQQAVGQGLAARQATAVDVERMQQRPASVPASSVGFSGANTPDHLHNMGSMALGLGTSAVGSPGFGQFLSQNPGAFGQAQLGGGLFAHTAAAASGGSHGVYHPFGSAAGTSLGPQSSGLNTGFPNMLNRSSSNHALASSSHHNLGQLATQQRAPLPYPGQGPSSLAGSLGYTANLSSAGSDRASPSSVAGRTNLAAQMGFGSNPNLQGLDQLQSQLPHREQLTWQQQLLAQQQQHQAPYDSYGNQGAFPGGFQSRQGHHSPAVPSWQRSAGSLHQPAALGQFDQSPTAAALPAPASHLAWNSGQSNQGPYPVHDNQFGVGQGQCFAKHAQPQVSTLNWQQQLQQQQLQQQQLQQGQGQGQLQNALAHANSPSAAAAADSWGWLDDFEHKQQAERLPGIGSRYGIKLTVLTSQRRFTQADLCTDKISVGVVPDRYTRTVGDTPRSQLNLQLAVDTRVCAMAGAELDSQAAAA